MMQIRSKSGNSYQPSFLFFFFKKEKIYSSDLDDTSRFICRGDLTKLYAWQLKYLLMDTNLAINLLFFFFFKILLKLRVYFENFPTLFEH